MNPDQIIEKRNSRKTGRSSLGTETILVEIKRKNPLEELHRKVSQTGMDPV